MRHHTKIKVQLSKKIYNTIDILLKLTLLTFDRGENVIVELVTLQFVEHDPQKLQQKHELNTLLGRNVAHDSGNQPHKPTAYALSDKTNMEKSSALTKPSVFAFLKDMGKGVTTTMYTQSDS